MSWGRKKERRTKLERGRERGGDESDWRRRMTRRWASGRRHSYCNIDGDWAEIVYYCGVMVSLSCSADCLRACLSSWSVLECGRRIAKFK